MKTITILSLISIVLIQSCTNNYPIVFSKETSISNIQLTLEEDNTFDYNAKSTKGVAFHEKGTFTINDTLLILDFTNREYSYNCYSIPLPNDTLLIVKYKNEYILYPIISNNPELLKFLNKNEIMQNLVAEYNTKEFPLLIGNKYFKQTKGNIESIYNNEFNISKYYDSLLKVDE